MVKIKTPNFEQMRLLSETRRDKTCLESDVMRSAPWNVRSRIFEFESHVLATSSD
jgi:hypothetical protein